MQASDDFTTHTQSMIDGYNTSRHIRQLIVLDEKFDDIYNPSTFKREDLKVDVLQSLADKVFHVMINLPVAVMLHENNYEHMLIHQDHMVEDTYQMMESIFDQPHFKQRFEITWFIHDRQDAYSFEDKGLMVAVLKPI